MVVVVVVDTSIREPGVTTERMVANEECEHV